MADTYICFPIDFATPEYDETVRLRYDILRRPLDLHFNPEDLATEFDSIHRACYHSGTMLLAGCLTLKPLESGDIKMRQVAVSVALQNQGIGSLMVNYAENVAIQSGFTRMVLHARISAVTFYDKMGYSVSGKTFKEVGIDHKFMYRKLV